MEEKKLTKGNIQKYNHIHRNICHKLRAAKNTWLVKQCREAEELRAKYAAFHFHKKLKEITNIFKRTNISKMIKNNKILIDSEEICRIWEEYI